MQAALIFATKVLVSAKSVWTIRKIYQQYEVHMYGGDSGHLWSSIGGQKRGMPGNFDAGRFQTLDAGVKEGVCAIPLSRPIFTGLILFIWTLTCVGELRRTVELFRRLVCHGSTSSRFLRVTIETQDSHDIFKLKTLGLNARALITLLIVLPRLGITFALLELGSRFLLATTSFENLIVNVLALAVIKDIKDLIYSTVVSAHDKRELELTRIAIADGDRRERSSLQSMLQASVWLIAAVAFVWLYMFRFQSVLPDYQWDVKRVCSPWIQERFVERSD
uniref:Uncharacterized protein n=1 Tax=Zooxanthella nutricula TaxID=1333877 RepID=A0A7S2QB19_9DINO